MDYSKPTADEEIVALLKSKFEKTLKQYEDDAFNEEDIPTLCKIHDAFGGLGGQQHNCLGCNFADIQIMIQNYLAKYDSFNDIKDSFILYIIQLYLLVERMEIVLDLVQVPQSYRDKHFKVFQQIRKWANFIKHPKAFILTHHPEYDFVDSGIVFDKTFTIQIDDSFVTEYYSGGTDPIKQKNKNKELYKILHNQKDVHVIFPDIEKLTKKLGYAVRAFSN